MRLHPCTLPSALTATHREMRERRGVDGLSLERQAERLSDVVGQAQPPLAAVLRAVARTHFVAKSALPGTPSRAFLGDAPLLLSSERKPLRWVPARVGRGRRKAEGGKNL